MIIQEKRNKKAGRRENSEDSINQNLLRFKNRSKESDKQKSWKDGDLQSESGILELVIFEMLQFWVKWPFHGSGAWAFLKKMRGWCVGRFHMQQ